MSRPLRRSMHGTLVTANGGVAEAAQGRGAVVGSVAVRDVGGEVQGVAFVQALLVALRAECEAAVQADHELLGAWGVSAARVVPPGLQAHLERLQAAVAPVDVEQPAANSR